MMSGRGSTEQTVKSPVDSASFEEVVRKSLDEKSEKESLIKYPKNPKTPGEAEKIQPS